MAEGSGELRGMTKLDGDYVWNGFRTIEGSVIYLETGLGSLL